MKTSCDREIILPLGRSGRWI